VARTVALIITVALIALFHRAEFTGAVSGVVIGFWDYFRVGAPLTIVTLAIGTLWLWP
jgi:hypothetical protein